MADTNQTNSHPTHEGRRAAREAVFTLLYETEYHQDETPLAIFTRSAVNRGYELEKGYVHHVYFGVMEKLPALDAIISRHAKGWKTNRLSRVSRAILRLGTYEIACVKDVPDTVAINEAVELTKKFDDPKARAFINGVLNAVKDEIAENGGKLPPAPAPSTAVETAVSAECAETAVTEKAPAGEVAGKTPAGEVAVKEPAGEVAVKAPAGEVAVKEAAGEVATVEQPAEAAEPAEAAKSEEPAEQAEAAEAAAADHE